MAEAPSLWAIDERLKTVEREIHEIKEETRDREKKVEQKIEEVSNSVEDLKNFNGRIEVMFANLVDSNKGLKEELGKLTEKVERDNGWKAVMIEMAKLGIVIVSLVVAGHMLHF